jgi:hypothetical protein
MQLPIAASNQMYRECWVPGQIPNLRCVSYLQQRTLLNYGVILVIGPAQWKNDHLKLEIDVDAELTENFASWLVTCQQRIMAADRA